MNHAITLLKIDMNAPHADTPSIDEQREIVEAYAKTHNYDIEREYIEFERRQPPIALSNRAKLTRAIERAQWLKAPIIVSHTDIVFHNISSFETLMQQGAKFIIVGLNHNQPATILSVDQPIAGRGNPDLAIARQQAVKIKQQRANDHAKMVMPLILEAKQKGIKSYRKIAIYLSQNGAQTARGGTWSAKQVSNIINRLETNMQNYLDDNGKIRLIPRKTAARELVLKFFIDKFDKQAEFTEKQVNKILNQWHSFDDYARVRRELVDANWLKRTTDGKKYWVNPDR